MAKLLCVARWPEGGGEYPEYPVELELGVEAARDQSMAEWLGCRTCVFVRQDVESERQLLLKRDGHVLKRDIARLASDLKTFLLQQRQNHLTFVPITPSFELWIHRLSDEQYRVIVWLDMAEHFKGASNVAYQGLRFTTNRARLMGFARGLESELQNL